MPPAVRILPMDSLQEFEGRNVEDVQQHFFLEELVHPDRPPGEYWYYKSGLTTPAGCVVLFQYSNSLIASATFLKAERFAVPKEGGYEGALCFDAKSVRVFHPIGPDVVTEIWAEFGGFSHVKWKLDPKGYPAFEGMLKDVETPRFRE